MSGVTDDDRGVSEGAGVAVLIIITLVATASVGLSVVISTGGGDEDKNDQGFAIKFEFFPDLEQLVMRYTGEKEVKAGNIVVSGPKGNVTWDTLANVESNKTLIKGARVIINEESGYGDKVTKKQEIRVVHKPPNGKTEAAIWNKGGGGEEGEGGEGEGPVNPTPPGSLGSVGQARATTG